jgi:hypothetical protein
MPRTLTIFFPDGETAYWFTALDFKVGDTLNHNGDSWIVTSIAPPGGAQDGDGKHTTVTVRPSELESNPEVV